MLQEIKNGNVVQIEGILSSINLNYKNFQNRKGENVNSIGGDITVKVDTVIDKKPTTLEIPVYMFASQYTNAGGINPAYESIERIKNDYVSIAASDIDKADRIRINKAKITMNEYYKNGKFYSFPRISASFVTKIKKDECKPEATFDVIFVIGEKTNEVDKDGVETGVYKVKGLVPQYGGKVDVVPFLATNADVIEVAKNYWNEGDTVHAIGKLNFSSTTETVEEPVDFGDPILRSKTISISDLIITGGLKTPLEGEMAIPDSDVTAALADRKERLAQLKAKDEAGPSTIKKTAPVQQSTNKFAGLGF